MTTSEKFIDQLAQLASLHDAGALTDDEYVAAKARVLASGPAPAQASTASVTATPELTAVPEPEPAVATVTTTAEVEEGGNAGLAVVPGTPVQPPEAAAAAAPASEPGPNTVTVPADELPPDHAGYNADSTEPVEVTVDPGPQRVMQPCPSCGRNETAVTTVPRFPKTVEAPLDPETGEPIEPGKTAHVCRSCGAILEVFDDAVDAVVEFVNERYAENAAEAEQEWAAAHPEAVAEIERPAEPIPPVLPVELWSGAERRTGAPTRRTTLGGPPDGERERRTGAWDRRQTTS